GLVCISLYCVDSVGFAGPNLDVLWRVFEYCCQLNAQGEDFVIMGDWNMASDVEGLREALLSVRAIPFAPGDVTCVQGEGSIIDFMAASSNLVSRLDSQVTAQLDSDLYPHRPVHLRMRGCDRPAWCRVADEPRPLSALPPPGCARPPYDWGPLAADAQVVTESDGLVQLWDAVLHGIDAELCARWDKVGAQAKAHSGRAGPLQVRWQLLRWRPRRRRHYRDGSVRPWVVAKRWMTHLTAVRQRLQEQLGGLNLAAAMCDLMPCQCFGVLRELEEAHRYLVKVSRQRAVLAAVDPTVAKYLQRGLMLLVSPHFDYCVDLVVRVADQKLSDAQAASEAAWRGRLQEAFLRGARGAHRASKIVPMQPLLQLEGEVQPYVVADAALQEWEDVWSHHGAAWLPKPADFDQWELLPPITVQDMRAAIWSYPATTARGPTRLAPKSLYFVSDEGLRAIARLLEAWERLGMWPDGRVESELVQMSKADGGKRLIALLHTLTRLWGKLRRPLGKR
ncbi:unnamed protein product, partial [Prorocentrum cordatum]